MLTSTHMNADMYTQTEKAHTLRPGCAHCSILKWCIEMVHTNAKYMYRNAMALMQMQMYVTSYRCTNTNHFSVWVDNTYRHVQLFQDWAHHIFCPHSSCHPLPGHNVLQSDHSGPAWLEELWRHEEPGRTEVWPCHAGATPAQCNTGTGEWVSFVLHMHEGILNITIDT